MGRNALAYAWCPVHCRGTAVSLALCSNVRLRCCVHVAFASEKKNGCAHYAAVIRPKKLIGHAMPPKKDKSKEDGANICPP